jgi:hypothetical protein
MWRAVRVRSDVSHLERPASAWNAERRRGGQKVGMPRNSEIRWV